MTREETKQYIEEVLQIKPVSDLRKGQGYEVNDQVFYLKATEDSPLVIHHHFTGDLHTNPISGVTPEQRLHHSSNLRRFPRCLPQEAESCGCDVSVRDIPALEALLIRMKVIIPPERQQARELTEINAARSSFKDLPGTEQTAITSARLGQDRFRNLLVKAWSGKCAVTEIPVQDLLRASHIKPWRDSDNHERLDPDNGLLLVATVDAAFDAGLISFEDDGTMLFSPKLHPPPHDLLSVRAGCRLTRSPSSRQQSFLRYHRDHVFRVVSSKSVPLRR